MSAACPRCGAAYPEDRVSCCPRCLLQADLAPARVGPNLELIEEIGEGGMGTIYTARHLRLGRTVVVKLVSPSLAGRAGLQERLEREAQALARLNHPGIVAVHDFAEEDGQGYIVMEYVAGRSLAESLPLPLERALDVAIQVCDALDYAHAQGVVHRDLKPANVLLEEGGRAKIADFGLARIRDAELPDARLTAAGTVVGTVHYIAPEAFRGAPPDPRMDIYSLGVVLYEMVTGQLPVGDFPRAPGDLDRIARKAMSRDPAERYQDVKALRAELLALARAPSLASVELEERNWMRAVALLLAVATGTALWALFLSITPRVVRRDDVLPLVMLGGETLADGSVVSRARFETGPTLAAAAVLGAAIAGYTLLRAHWKRTGLLVSMPDRPVPGAWPVMALGVGAVVLFFLRAMLESEGVAWPRTYVPLFGGLIELSVVFLFWVAVLEAWRTGRKLRHEPLLWLGMALALVPPVFQFVRHVATWRP